MAGAETFSDRPKSTFASYGLVQDLVQISLPFSPHTGEQSILLFAPSDGLYLGNSVLIQVDNESSVSVFLQVLQSYSTSHLAVSITTH